MYYFLWYPNVTIFLIIFYDSIWSVFDATPHWQIGVESYKSIYYRT